jgi:glycosyltransferase involved in cell wall biosynthesis
MRFLMLNPFYAPYLGGTEKHVVEVSKRLAAKKHDVTVLTARLPGTKKEEVVGGVRVVRSAAYVVKNLPAFLPPPVPITPLRWMDIVREARKADAVHVHNRFCYGLIDALTVKGLGKKLGLTLHNARTKGLSPVTDALGQAYDDVLGKNVMRACDVIAGVSDKTVKETVPESMWGKCSVIYNGTDTELFNPRVKPGGIERELGLKKGFVLTNCRLVPQKGVGHLIEAMKGVDRQLVVFGRGPLKDELEKQAKKKGVDAAFVSQRITDGQLARLYSACSVFALPSLWEPFGMVLTEAMSCGKPVVGTNAGGIPEVIGNAGAVVPKAEPRALRKAIKELLEDEKKARDYGKKGRKRVLAKFTWDHTAQGYEKMYGELE